MNGKRKIKTLGYLNKLKDIESAMQISNELLSQLKMCEGTFFIGMENNG